MIFGPVDQDGTNQGLLISAFVGAAVALVIIPMIFSSTRIDLLDTSVKITTMKFFSKEVAGVASAHDSETGPLCQTGFWPHFCLLNLAVGYLTGGPTVTFTLANGSWVTASASNLEQVVAEVNSRIGAIA
ncbi:hypothetical protein E4U03_10210 [Rothia nasimurium]|uniref:Uncharacterized protein n=1 Tax=Rothia nasimurium TaxID=85336 RepID=A0A4Y9F174_9MICC|nr:hypothetical protein [Rothia nasimurium]MBF0808971.1 hypothetical protein [Rothia nasimurium]TFU20985.1 hypothetical protein E4U03_10210 [Rothia nasimurium]